MYKQIGIGRRNTGYSCVPTEEDLNQVLELLNRCRYTPRYKPRSDHKDLIEKAQKNLNDQAEEHHANGLLDDIGKILYPWNCHSLAREIHKLNANFRIIHGYLFSINPPPHATSLLSHSAVLDSHGDIVDVTTMDEACTQGLGFPLESYQFLVHDSGRCGINLTVDK